MPSVSAVATMSSFPSPSMSPAATEEAPAPTVKGAPTGMKWPAPSPPNTWAVPASRSVTTKSVPGLPSRSPRATPEGFVPTETLAPRARLGVPVPRSEVTVPAVWLSARRSMKESSLSRPATMLLAGPGRGAVDLTTKVPGLAGSCVRISSAPKALTPSTMSLRSSPSIGAMAVQVTVPARSSRAASAPFPFPKTALKIGCVPPAVNTSGLPSSFRSPTAARTAPSPTRMVSGAA